MDGAGPNLRYFFLQEILIKFGVMHNWIFNNYLIHPILFLLIFLGACQSSGHQQNKKTKQASANPPKYQDKGHIPCFVYHRFGNDKYPSTNIPLDSFRAHLEYLKQNHFNVITLGEAVHKLKTDQNIPEKTVVLTVDDGYRTFKTGAMPLLQEFDYSATLFVNTETVGGKNYLTWDELKQIRQKGIEIGNHSHSHDHFVNRKAEGDKEYFKADTRKAQAMFKKKLGVKPSLYAYPYGEYTSTMQSTLKKLDFEAATAQKSGVLKATSDMFAIPRFPMAANFVKLKRFKQKANMRGMPVVEEKPKTTIVEKNPPVLEIKVKRGLLRPNGVQCFVGGSRECSIEVDTTDKTLSLIVQSTKKLTGRRTLYTVTAPSQNGQEWYWYSHLWIRKDESEPY